MANETKPHHYSREEIEKEIAFLSASSCEHKCRTADMMQQLLDDREQLADTLSMYADICCFYTMGFSGRRPVDDDNGSRAYEILITLGFEDKAHGVHCNRRPIKEVTGDDAP